MLPALLAMRVLVDGMIDQLEAAAEAGRAPVAPADGSCPHPAERQVDATVLGGVPEVVCLVCGAQRVGTP